MSRGNLLLGQRVGKVGDSVYYRSKGEMHKRRYVAHPRDPKSFKQAQQRAKFAAVALAYNFFRVIIDRSTRWRDRLTAYNDFQARNYNRAPYASKSERQQWDKFISLPAVWSLASGPLARPAMWSITPYQAPSGRWTTLDFAKANEMCRQILGYARQNNWLPDTASDGDALTLTAEQISEALAQAPNTHVCLMWCETERNETSGETLLKLPVHIGELTADYFSGIEQIFSFDYTTATGWRCYTPRIFQKMCGDALFFWTIGASVGDNSNNNNYWSNDGDTENGILYASWIANNNGYAVQTSDIVAQMSGDGISQTARDRCDLTNERTLAAVMTWQE